MKKILSLFIFLPFAVSAQPPFNGFKIEGKLDGYPDGTRISLVQNNTNQEMASATLQKGKFTMRQTVEEPVLCYLIIDGVEKPVELYVENTSISIKGNKATKDKYEISGSASHKDFTQFISSFLPAYQQLASLVSTINNTVPGQERDKLMTTYTSMHQGIQNLFDKFIKEHPASFVSPFVLNLSLQFNDDVNTLETRYNMLSEKLRSSRTGQALAASIAEKKIGSVGTMAMDFTQADTAGVSVALSSFRGKYVLVDFWASWCGPCRQENPNVLENYNNFRNKNFTVLGVSLDRPGQKDKWIEAIRKDNLNWTQVSDLQFWNNAAAKLYHISSIPQNILIDPNGKIVGKNLRGPDLRAKLCEIFGCN